MHFCFSTLVVTNPSFILLVTEIIENQIDTKTCPTPLFLIQSFPCICMGSELLTRTTFPGNIFGELAKGPSTGKGEVRHYKENIK